MWTLMRGFKNKDHKQFGNPEPVNKYERGVTVKALPLLTVPEMDFRGSITFQNILYEGGNCTFLTFRDHRPGIHVSTQLPTSSQVVNDFVPKGTGYFIFLGSQPTAGQE